MNSSTASPLAMANKLSMRRFLKSIARGRRPRRTVPRKQVRSRKLAPHLPYEIIEMILRYAAPLKSPSEVSKSSAALPAITRRLPVFKRLYWVNRMWRAVAQDHFHKLYAQDMNEWLCGTSGPNSLAGRYFCGTFHEFVVEPVSPFADVFSEIHIDSWDWGDTHIVRIRGKPRPGSGIRVKEGEETVRMLRFERDEEDTVFSEDRHEVAGYRDMLEQLARWMEGLRKFAKTAQAEAGLEARMAAIEAVQTFF